MIKVPEIASYPEFGTGIMVTVKAVTIGKIVGI
jgi:hypothetical protein